MFFSLFICEPCDSRLTASVSLKKQSFYQPFECPFIRHHQAHHRIKERFVFAAAMASAKKTVTKAPATALNLFSCKNRHLKNNVTSWRIRLDVAWLQVKMCALV